MIIALQETHPLETTMPLLLTAKRFTGLLFAVFMSTVTSPLLADEKLTLEALATPGHVAIMRHAIAPGTGDPDSFSLRDCSTQRNLSEEGRQQARDTGEYLRANGLPALAVYTSQWCRCLETASLLEYGEPEELPFLNSFFQNWERETPQTESLMRWLSDYGDGPPAILVTHQVNITALTEVYPESGEIVVVKIGSAGSIAVIGTLKR